MKLLFALLLALPFGLSPIGNLQEAFTSCGIATPKIKAVLLTVSPTEYTEVNIAELLSLEVVDTLEPDAYGSFPDIPSETYLSNIGLIIWRGNDAEDWASFGIVQNEALGRYWLILFPTNIFVVDSVSCGAFELLLSE